MFYEAKGSRARTDVCKCEMSSVLSTSYASPLFTNTVLSLRKRICTCMYGCMYIYACIYISLFLISLPLSLSLSLPVSVPSILSFRDPHCVFFFFLLYQFCDRVHGPIRVLYVVYCAQPVYVDRPCIRIRWQAGRRARLCVCVRVCT